MTNSETEQLIEQNNQLREQLTKENERYYSDLLVYTRIRGFFLNEQQLEEQLLQILQDMLDAQNDGVSAADYYGHQPQQLAEQLLDTFPKASNYTLVKWAGYIFGLSSFYTLLSQFSDATNQLRVGSFVLNGLLTILFIVCVFLIIQKSIYQRLIQNKIILYTVCSLLIGGLLVGVIGSQIFLPSFITISVSNRFMITLIGLFLVVITVYYLKHWTKQRAILVAIGPFLYFSALCGLLIRTASLQELMNSLPGKTLLVAGNIICLIWFYIRFFAAAKKE